MSERLSHYRVTTNRFGETIQVPVIDVRDGQLERSMVIQIIKATNNSRYIKFNEYHKSKKKI